MGVFWTLYTAGQIPMIDIRPIVAGNPRAVFVVNTDLRSMDDRIGFLGWGRRLGEQIFVDVPGNEAQQVVLKPNITLGFAQEAGGIVPGQEGVVTDPYFLAGLADGLRVAGAERVVMAEGGEANDPIGRLWCRGHGYLMAERGVEVLDLNTPRYTESSAYTDFNWVHVDGVFFRDIPFVPPINSSDALVVNVPTLKAHNLTGFSLSVKNLQGMLPQGEIRAFCRGVERLRSFPDHVSRLVQPDAADRVAQQASQHRLLGYRDWEDEAQAIRNEGYCAQAMDCLSGARVRLHLVEGIRSRDGSGFRHGTDYLTNLVVFGTNAISVDAVCAYLVGHRPESVGYLRIGCERGLGENEIGRIEIYLWNDGDPKRVEDPSSMKRYAIGAHLHGDRSAPVFF